MLYTLDFGSGSSSVDSFGELVALKIMFSRDEFYKEVAIRQLAHPNLPKHQRRNSSQNSERILNSARAAKQDSRNFFFVNVIEKYEGVSDEEEAKRY